MKRKVNVIIPSQLCDEFEQFITCNPLAKYERFSCGTPIMTRYKLTGTNLHSAVVSIYYNSSVECTQENRSYLLYCIARDLLDPVTIVEP